MERAEKRFSKSNEARPVQVAAPEDGCTPTNALRTCTTESFCNDSFMAKRQQTRCSIPRQNFSAAVAPDCHSRMFKDGIAHGLSLVSSKRPNRPPHFSFPALIGRGFFGFICAGNYDF
jgi:hypothetical protein